MTGLEVGAVAMISMSGLVASGWGSLGLSAGPMSSGPKTYSAQFGPTVECVETFESGRGVSSFLRFSRTY